MIPDENSKISNWYDIAGRIELSPSCILDFNRHKVLRGKEDEHVLSKKEFRCLQFMAYYCGQTILSERIYDQVWEIYETQDREAKNAGMTDLGLSGEGTDAYARQNVRDLVNGIRSIHEELRKRIVTVRGYGYRFELQGMDKRLKTGKQEGNVSAELRHVKYRDLIKLGYTKEQIGEALVENDRSLYGDVGGNEGDARLWAFYLSSYPDSFQYVINEKDKIVGNWSMLVPSADSLAKIRKGGFLEEEFEVSETEFLLFPSVFNAGYILNFSINEGWQTAKNYSLLWQSFISQIQAWAEQGIFFRSWIVNVFRADHEALYKSLGFRYLADNVNQGKLYELAMQPFPRGAQWHHSPELEELYETNL